MPNKNLLQDSNAYYDSNDYYEIFSQAEDGENKVSNYLNSISKNKIIVDAGCGTGKFLNVLETNAKQYIGIDLSDKQLKKAQDKSQKENSIFINSNLSSIPLEDNSIDLIVSTWVLGTMLDLEERERCLNELKRVLKIDGSIILVENAEDSEFEIIRNHHQDLPTKMYNNWIKDHGFYEIENINTYFNFQDEKTAKECFEVIYGEEIASKIKNNKIEHKIVIFKFDK